MPIKKIAITKRQAACDQLATAIKLYFENRDLVSAYTLCAAADGILEGIWTKERNAILQRQIKKGRDAKNLRFSIKEEWDIRLNPEYKKDAFRMLARAQNFFKHADKDHKEDLPFAGLMETEIRLICSIQNYALVFDALTPAMAVFSSCYLLTHPDHLIENSPLRSFIEDNPFVLNSVRGLNHSEMMAAGYQTLKRACPELFPPSDIF